jgi:hypothetical protein
MSDPSDGTGGAPYIGAGTWGGEYAIGMGGACCSMRGLPFCGDATAEVISIRTI